MSATPAAEQVSIPRRFNGPPESSNGGYACGIVARLLEADVAEVTLRRPPPLERPLSVVREPGLLRLEESGEVVAEGRRIEGVELEPPTAVSAAAAAEASRRFPWFEGHPFPTCFVCGPQRRRGEGLGIFTGSLAEQPGYACDWTPSREWADEHDAVRGEIVWAALDCPSAVAAAATAAGDDDPAVAVLGRLSASLEAPVPVEQRHVVLAWPLGREGRKRSAGSAVLTAEGAVLARARALWVEVR